MKSETDLETLLKNLSPELHKGDYVFCTLAIETKLEKVEFIATFIEKEGKTLVVEKEIANSMNLEYKMIMSWITLNAYSSLKAVGLTAAVSSILAKNNISCNIIAAYHHDHIFVPKDDALQAIDLLRKL